MPTRLHHAVEDGQQLAHAGDQGNFLGLAGREQPLVEDLDHWVVASGYQRPHVKRRPHSCPATPYSAFAAQSAAVPAEGGYTH